MIFALVVIYNVTCMESQTCKSLLKQSEESFKVLVYDNSDTDYGNQSFCIEHGWTYLGGNGNHGLSKAYNAAISFLAQSVTAGYICLLDDDTTLPSDFFRSMCSYAQANSNADALIPILTQNGKIISPCRKGTSKRRRYFVSIDECLNELAVNIQAFNSGMIINLRVFQTYRYDERIFLDGVDHAFLRHMALEHRCMIVVPCQCQHSFSGGQKSTKAGALSRFTIYARDSRVLYENDGKAYWTIVGRRCLHLCLQYKTFAFLKILFSS